MTLPVNAVGENSQQPGIYAECFIPDQLIAGSLKLITQPIMIPQGANYPRGAVLGQQTTSSIVVAAGANNAGNGSVGSTALGATETFGVFVLTAVNANTFNVVDPEGNALPQAIVGTAYAQNEINFKITAGATAFAAGDTFTLNALEATGNYVLSVKTATDGSQVPSAILATATNATTAPQLAGGYLMGEFNQNAITFDPSWTVPGLQAAMRQFSIFLKSSVSATDPS